MVWSDKRRLVREQIRAIFEEPDEFERRVLATYDDNSYVEHFRCHIMADETRAERWLEHWSRPIEVGRYAGGRSEHYVDVTAFVEADAGPVAPMETIHTSALRSLRSPLAQMQAKVEEALAGCRRCSRKSCSDDPAVARSQLSTLAERLRRSVEQSLRPDAGEPGGSGGRR